MAQSVITMEQPRVHVLHMLVVTLLVGVLGAMLYLSIKDAFMASPFLNGMILAMLGLGMIYAFVSVFRLIPEVNWINNYQLGENTSQRLPKLVGPIATMLGDASKRTVLTPQSMRSLLDSLASRLDESRDVLRYLVGLLIFLGLLGTFWGLLQTVSSVGAAIGNLDVTATQSSSVFEELKTGLKAPLDGMGLSFSSSLFGLAGSLILGLFELIASRAQNRFYHNLEDWLSTITDVEAGSESSNGSVMPSFMRLDLQSLQRSLDRLGQQLEQGKGVGGGAAAGDGAGPAPSADTLEQLADAVAGLVTQMRDEQKMVRNWIQTQQVQQSEIQRLLIRQSGVRGKE